TLILLGLCVGSASWTWSMVLATPQAAMPWIIGGAIGGFVLAMITSFYPKAASITGPLYALAEGLFLGGLTATINARYPGIAMQAVGLTFGTMFALLMAYQTGLIKATENFKLGVFAATGGIAMLYLVSMVLGFFSIQVPFIHDSNWFGIAFSGFVVVIAALNLVLDFDFIEAAAARGTPKYMEWYAAFGLMVTLVWLYVEILRLLMKLRSNER
ncbi:MAG: Bax inhibitor-1/YccA family protein, partial [Planctomycetaceae bacterium]|nr:Bax inhibitor-1/YccA family protein [Planctomycetaceae bacterium]